MAGNLYEALGVSKAASAAEIKSSYRRLALLHHPDKNGDQQEFQRVAMAYRVLSDPSARSYYDKTGSTEGIDVSAEDFLSQFYALMQESLGGFTVKVRCAAPAADGRAAVAQRPRSC